MSYTPLDRETLPLFSARLAGITAGSQARWGALDGPGVLRHLRRSVEISLGEVAVKDESSLFTRTILKWLVFHLLPWPKGRIRAPEVFLPAAEGGVDEERGRLVEALGRFVEAVEKDPGRRTISPFLGPTALAYWCRIHGKHFDHHLRQFGR